MKEELIKELIADTTMEDIPERYQGIVEIVGIEKFAELSNYAMGDEIYFPKVENIVSPARNRRIRKEYKNGLSCEKLAKKYNLTIKQIWNILKDESICGQMTIEEYEKAL